MTSQASFGGPEGPSVGSAAEEAARLVEAVRQWIDSKAAPAPTRAASPECQVCPICQLLAVVRQGQPEVFEHLSQAADAILAAVRAGIAGHESHWAQATRPDVEHIDVT
jgi:Family of unknown function (DUF5304)